MNTRIIPPLKTHNRFHPSPTKDEIAEWANQDDNYTYAKGLPIIKSEEVKGRLGNIDESQFKEKVSTLAPRIERIK